MLRFAYKCLISQEPSFITPYLGIQRQHQLKQKFVGSKKMAQMKVLVVLSLLLILALAAEGRTIGIDAAGDAKGGEDATLVCNSLHGAEDGDTCFSVAKQFKLSTQVFLVINPNINCDSIFVGQWLCVDGTVFS